MHRLTLTILALALLIAACGGGEGFGGTTSAPTTVAGETTVPTTTPTTVPLETTTTAPTAETTSTSAPPATTTTTSGTHYEVNTSDFFPDPFPGSSGGAHGSGCVVADYVTLPDGVWFGFVEAVGGGAIDFDLACFFTGAAAVTAAGEDGEEAFDFYIRNKVAVTYHVPVAPIAQVWYVSMTAPDVSIPTRIPLASWPSPDSFQDCPSDHCAVWLYVNRLQATAIVEQYLP